MAKTQKDNSEREYLIKKLMEDERSISHMLEELESIDKMVSVIYSEKNEERAIFCLLLLLTTKVDLGYVESYYFGYDHIEDTLTYKEGYFDLKRISDSKLERIYSLAQEKVDVKRVGFIEDIMNKNQPVYNLKRGEHNTPYEFINRLSNYTIVPICYGEKKYGIIVLAGNRKLMRFEKKEREIVDLFKYSLSMYLYNRKLEIKELKNERLKTIGHFANSIVHEFKTPVSVIKGLAALAKNKLDDPKKLEHYLDNIIKEADRIVDMSQEVSEYAEIREKTLNNVDFDLMDVIRGEVEKISKHLERLQIQVIYKGEKSWEITGDREKFSRLIGYIFKNSMENVDYEKEDRYLLIDTCKDKGRLVLEDNGCGISRENLDKVFNPFFSTKINGTGLGLTIVKEGLKKQKINVRAESEEKEYTRIIIEI